MKLKLILLFIVVIHPLFSQVGIGTTTPQQELHIDGSKSGLQTIRIDDIAVTTGGTNPGELATSITSANKALYTDARGDIQSRYVLGDNTQGLIIIGSQNINSTTLVDINNASITFTPRHSTVYLSFCISGSNPLNCPEAANQQSWFSVGVDLGGSNVANFASLTASTNTTTANSASSITVAQLPITVIPGTPVTLKLQGRDGGTDHECGFTIDSSNFTSYMTITD